MLLAILVIIAAIGLLWLASFIIRIFIALIIEYMDFWGTAQLAAPFSIRMAECRILPQAEQ